MSTYRRIEFLVNGARDSAGAVVASGKLRVYDTGTTTPLTIYQDAGGSSAHAQPVTLDAAGRATVFVKNACRIIIKDSTDTTTLVDTEYVQRAEQVMVEHSTINGGAQTTVHDQLVAAAASLGQGFNYLESATATARAYSGWLGEMAVSVKDFGAIGDDSADDTSEIQAAIDRVAARGGGWVFIPKGTYKVSSLLTCNTAGVKIRGAGIGVSVIKQYGAVGGISFDYGSSPTDSKMVLEDLTLTRDAASTTTGILIDEGKNFLVRNVEANLHQVAFKTTSGTSHVSGGRVQRLIVTTAGSGTNPTIDLSANTTYIRFSDCAIQGHNSAIATVSDSGTGTAWHRCDFDGGGTANTGLQVATYGLVDNCTFKNFASGISVCRDRSRVAFSTFDTNTSNIVTGDNKCVIIGNTAVTGSPLDASSVAAASSNTLGLMNQGGSTGPNYSTSANSEGGMPVVLGRAASQTNSSSSATFTPDFAPTSGGVIRSAMGFTSTYSAGAPTITIGAPTNTACIQNGQLVAIVLAKTGANAMNLTWNAAWVDPDSSALNGLASVASNTQVCCFFTKSSGSVFTLLGVTSAIAI